MSLWCEKPRFAYNGGFVERQSSTNMTRGMKLEQLTRKELVRLTRHWLPVSYCLHFALVALAAIKAGVLDPSNPVPPSDPFMGSVQVTVDELEEEPTPRTTELPRSPELEESGEATPPRAAIASDGRGPSKKEKPSPPKVQGPPNLLSRLGPDEPDKTRACAILDLKRMPEGDFGRGVANAVDRARGLRLLLAGLDVELSTRCNALAACSATMNFNSAWLACAANPEPFDELSNLVWVESPVTQAVGPSPAVDWIPRDGISEAMWPHGARADLLIAKVDASLLLLGPKPLIEPLLNQGQAVLTHQLRELLAIDYKPDQKPFFVLQLKGITRLGRAPLLGEIRIPCEYEAALIIFSVRGDKMITDYRFSFDSQAAANEGMTNLKGDFKILDALFGKPKWSLNPKNGQIVNGRSTLPRTEGNWRLLVAALNATLLETSPSQATQLALAQRRRRVPPNETVESPSLVGRDGELTTPHDTKPMASPSASNGETVPPATRDAGSETTPSSSSSSSTPNASPATSVSKTSQRGDEDADR